MQVPDSALEGGRMTENIMHFARLLRAAGLPLGPGKVLERHPRGESGRLRQPQRFP